MDSTELLGVFRDEMRDIEAPYLWSDAAVYRYMDDAQKMFCRRTEGIEDARTTSVCQISVIPATEWYAISPLILKLRGVTRGDTGRDVPVFNPERLDERDIIFDGSTGNVRALVAGLSKGSLRAWPMPDETVSLNLSVFRLPLDTITDDGDQVLEIDQQHHEALLFWMKHKAYDKQDAETFDRRKSDEFGQRFLDYCTAARIEQERARRTVGTVAYGGI